MSEPTYFCNWTPLRKLQSNFMSRGVVCAMWMEEAQGEIKMVKQIFKKKSPLSCILMDIMQCLTVVGLSFKYLLN